MTYVTKLPRKRRRLRHTVEDHSISGTVRRLCIVAILLSSFCGKMVSSVEAQAPQKAVPTYTYTIVNSYPHDPDAYTQGLEYRDGFLYESTGLPGRSTLREVRLETGEVIRKTSLPSPLFGEGITVLNHQVVQLTWQHHIGFVYDLARFHQLRTFQFPGEGWGLANDGGRIFMSDGTAEIRLLDPVTLQEKRRITVTDGGKQVVNLNELEYVRGELFANVWQTDSIARISPNDGRVLGWIDLTGLLPVVFRQNADVLNGIAYDAAKDRLFVTGKLWPRLFEIKLAPRLKN
jgi:glutamine cyclotransferase